MTFVTNILRDAIALFVPSRSSPIPKTRKNTAESIDHGEEMSRKPASKRRKRSRGDDLSNKAPKRRRIDRKPETSRKRQQTSDSTEASTTTFVQPQSDLMSPKNDADRAMMPPPALTPLKAKTLIKTNQSHGKIRSSVEPDSASTATKSTRKLTNEYADEYNMEKARRHAAATTLPPNSGMWERGEKDLFYHLAYRGFEPLLPASWMRDFPTLPLSLYAIEDDQIPLIQNQNQREFRAIRELRELLDLGKNVRDKVLSSPGARRESVIERTCSKYISWALSDIGVKLPALSKPTRGAVDRALPIHIIVTLKAGQTTTDCLFELKNKLHTLAARHRQHHNIHASVEQYENHDGRNIDVTCVAEPFADDLPVLYGIMICRSILAVFTMNSHTPPPKVGYRTNHRQSFPHQMNETAYRSRNQSISTNILTVGRDNDGKILDDDPEDSASDPRFISDFDFSDPARDVWNALVIAIIAMQIRTDMLARGNRYEDGHAVSDLLDDDDEVECSKLQDGGKDDDPDA